MATWLFSCAGDYGPSHQHDERFQSPSHPCWGWLSTHTYHFGRAIEITKIEGYLVFGPSEGATVTIECQLSLDEINWITIGSKTSWASTASVPFVFSVNSINAAHMRFITNSDPGAVDGSRGVVTFNDYKKIINLNASIVDSSVFLNWDYSVEVYDPTRIDIYRNSPSNAPSIFIKTIYFSDPSEYTDNSLEGFVFPYEKIYYTLILFSIGDEIIESVTTNITYPSPQPIINLQIIQEEENIILNWNHGNGVPALLDEIYIKKEDGNLILLKIQDSSIESFIDSEPKNNGVYTYYLRSRGEISSTWSPFVFGSVDFFKLTSHSPRPQIEFGLGGEVLRHAIYTYHDDYDSSKNLLLFKLWESINKNSLEEPNLNNPDVVLCGDKTIFIKNIIPMIHNMFDLGKNTDIWRKVYTVNTYSDNSNSVKLKLWNGK